MRRNASPELGAQHVGHVLETCRRQLDPAFSPQRVLDFGCGVGRLVIPFARVARHVVGLDVSDDMLREAALNCGEQSISNVSLRKSDDALRALQGDFDLIHSYSVFQHIPFERGKRLFLGLLRHLRPGGIGVLHFTYWARSREPQSALRKLVDRLRASRAYDVNALLLVLQSAGVARIYTELTDDGGELGLMLYFQRPAQ